MSVTHPHPSPKYQTRHHKIKSNQIDIKTDIYVKCEHTGSIYAET
jgi:hypothetical protein